jgi:hypothetical protein
MTVPACTHLHADTGAESRTSTRHREFAISAGELLTFTLFRALLGRIEFHHQTQRRMVRFLNKSVAVYAAWLGMDGAVR